MSTTTEQERLLIVKINHLAERLEPYGDQQLAVHAAHLYATADGQLHRGLVQDVAEELAANLTQAPESASLRCQLFAALSELQISLPPAPIQEPARHALPQALAPPAPHKPHASIRKAAARIRSVIGNRRRKEETPTAGAMRATAKLMACVPTPPRP